MSRLRHALRDVTEVEEGHPSAAAKPAFRPNTGSMPVAHVAPLRKGTVAGEAPATGRSNASPSHLSPSLSSLAAGSPAASTHRTLFTHFFT